MSQFRGDHEYEATGTGASSMASHAADTTSSAIPYKTTSLRGDGYGGGGGGGGGNGHGSGFYRALDHTTITNPMNPKSGVPMSRKIISRIEDNGGPRERNAR
jgi:hypothetical protein